MSLIEVMNKAEELTVLSLAVENGDMQDLFGEDDVISTLFAPTNEV